MKKYMYYKNIRIWNIEVNILGDFMKKSRKFIFIITIILILVLTSCQDNLNSQAEKSNGKIHLYGEKHNIQKILDKELEIWGEYYTKDNMRHLFIESPYYTAEFLNLWMKSDNDDIFEEIYNDWKGTQSYSESVKEFYKKIKSLYPETIFHGTDVGHQYDTIGQRYLNYLKDNNLENSEKYLMTEEIIEQGKHFYNYFDDEYRENKMVDNFIREFDKLKDENVMGIYGAAHTVFGKKAYKSSVYNMATQLKELYGDNISSNDLSLLGRYIKPLAVVLFLLFIVVLIGMFVIIRKQKKKIL